MAMKILCKVLCDMRPLLGNPSDDETKNVGDPDRDRLRMTGGYSGLLKLLLLLPPP
jgi:hypothetical protein